MKMERSYANAMQNLAHEFTFISSEAAQCNLPSCGRTSTHLHCRFCGFGTSQVTNAAAHARVCPSGDISQSDSSYPSTTSQPFTYYPATTQANSTNTKITQPGGVFNFSQYSGLYGPQTVFPNANLFSPSSFNTFGQIDHTWISQTRLLPPPTEQNTNCCQNKQETELDNGKNWSKYPDSISLFFLEQNKDSEECINVDDICFDNKEDDEAPRSSCMQKSMNLESSDSEESDIVVEDSETNSDTAECLKCFVCEQTQKSMTPISKQTPLAASSQTSVFHKLVCVLEETFDDLTNATICGRCLNLINTVDNLQLQLNSAINDLRVIYKAGKENVKSNKEKPYCHVCNKTFSSVTKLNRHQQYHTKSFAFCCEYCGRGFTTRDKLESHVMLHTNSYRFQCELCGKQFLQKHTLTSHIRQHKGEYRYHCLVCSKGFVQKTVFQIHVQSHEAGKFICQHCGRKMKTYSNLMVHIRICSGNLAYECMKCQKKFPLKSQLDRHVAFKHQQKSNFVCNVCHKGFWRESDVISHLQTHTDDRPFACQACGKRYKSKKNLNHHMKLHEKSKLDCGICGKAFTRADALADHVNQHTGRKPYECKICWKRFANRINFSVHLKRHSKPTKTSCKVCGKVLGKSLKEHMRVHSMEKAFSCKFCLTSFTFKSSLNKHLKNKHENQEANKVL